MDTRPLEAPEIVLLADEDCPNAAPARALLREMLAELGLPAEFAERRCGDPSLPPGLRRLGSPTILVDGRDALGERGEAQASSCRIYRDASGRTSGLPPRETLKAAIAAAAGPDARCTTGCRPFWTGGPGRGHGGPWRAASGERRAVPHGTTDPRGSARADRGAADSRKTDRRLTDGSDVGRFPTSGRTPPDAPEIRR